MISISATTEEKKQGRLTPEHLAAATRALQADGLVVLEGIVDGIHLPARISARRSQSLPTAACTWWPDTS